MSLNHSPSIVTNGLVFAYDMGNTKKSWKGKPTTNFFTNGHFSGGTGIPQESGSVATNTIVSLINPGNSDYVLRQNGSGTEYQINLTNQLLPSTTYCMSGWYAQSPDYNGASTMFHSRAFSASGAHVALDVGLYNVIETKVVNGITWKYCYATITTPADYNNSFNWYLGYGTTNTAGYRYYTNIQMELGSYPTPFINGTRSNTQSIIDLVGSNTITATSLTYANDNTFSFNGSSDYIQAPYIPSVTVNTDYSFSAWINVTNGGVVFQNSSGGSDRNGLVTTTTSATFGYYAGTAWTGVTAPITANTWCNVVGTFVGSTRTQKIYVNGVVSTTASSGIYVHVVPTLYIGRQSIDLTNLYNGKISNVTIYNRTLSDAEVKQNFNALRGRYGI